MAGSLLLRARSSAVAHRSPRGEHVELPPVFLAVPGMRGGNAVGEGLWSACAKDRARGRSHRGYGRMRRSSQDRERRRIGSGYDGRAVDQNGGQSCGVAGYGEGQAVGDAGFLLWAEREELRGHRVQGSRWSRDGIACGGCLPTGCDDQPRMGNRRIRLDQPDSRFGAADICGVSAPKHGSRSATAATGDKARLCRSTACLARHPRAHVARQPLQARGNGRDWVRRGDESHSGVDVRRGTGRGLRDAILVAVPGVVQGESGGPAVNSAGRVVGVIVGSAPGIATLTPVTSLTSLPSAARSIGGIYERWVAWSPPNRSGALDRRELVTSQSQPAPPATAKG